MTPALRDEIQKVLDRQGTSDLAFHAIACRVVEDFEARAAVVYTPDPGTGLLKLRCHCGLSREIAETLRFQCLGKGLTGRAASLREPVQAGEGEAVPSPAEREAFPDTALFVPMLAGASLRGVVGIARGFHRAYAPDEIAALAAVARLIAAYLK